MIDTVIELKSTKLTAITEEHVDSDPNDLEFVGAYLASSSIDNVV